jgi:hypothetical protein
MKVACVGNMNNNFFALARHLRDRGVDAHVLLLDIEMSHFHPAADSYDLSYQSYTHLMNWGAPFAFGAASPQKLRDDLAEYDVLIASGTAPAFIHRAGRTVDVFMPFGSDLIDYPFLRIVHPRYQLSYTRFTRAQRAGIENSRWVHLDLSNSDFEGCYQRLHCKGKRLTAGLPIVYTPIYSPHAIANYYDRTHWFHEFKRIRDSHDLVVFHHGRHHWKTTVEDISRKANDNLIRGFASFVRSNPDFRAALVTLEYGRDVVASKALIAELGIASNVFWFPQMARKDLMVGLNLSDIGTGEFHRSWFSFGTMYETLAMAKPFLHYRNDELYRDFYPEMYPLMNARTDHEIAAQLQDFRNRPEHFRELGERGRQWFEKFVIGDVLDAYMRIIESGRNDVGARAATSSGARLSPVLPSSSS